MQTRNAVEGLHNFEEFSQPTEWKKVRYCFYKIIFKICANLKRHNIVYILSSRHNYRPTRARVVAQLVYKTLGMHYTDRYGLAARVRLFVVPYGPHQLKQNRSRCSIFVVLCSVDVLLFEILHCFTVVCNCSLRSQHSWFVASVT